MKRDALLPLAALLFAVLALPSGGIVALPFVPADPAGLLDLYGTLAAALLLTGAATRGRERGAGWRPLALAVVLVPFFLYAIWAAPAQAIRTPYPALGLPLLALVLAAFAALGRRAVTSAVVVLVVLLGGGAVLARAGIDAWPRAWNPLSEPTRAAAPERVTPVRRVGIRMGAPVRVEAADMPLGEGYGPWWRPANAVRVPLRPPIALIFDGAADGRSLERGETVSLVHGSEVSVRHALDLDGFDAVVVLEKGWSQSDPARARRLATAVSSFVRRGGLLIGPPPERRWPPSLARRLGDAGQAAEAGMPGLRTHGMGRVVRAASGEQMRKLLESELWVRDARTVFDRAAVPPDAPAQLVAADDSRSDRRAALYLLVALVGVLWVFDWIFRGASSRAMGALMAALVVCMGIAWVVPSHPGFSAAGVVLELGGAGGRRVEAVRIEAGSGGYAGRVVFSGSGMVRVLGGRLDAEGRVLIEPGGAAWVVRETLGLGAGPEEREDRFAGWARPLLTGRVDSKQIRYGRGPALPVRVEGAGALPAVVVRYRGL